MNFSNSSCRLCFGLCCEVPIVVKAKPMPPSVWYLLCSLQLRSSGHFWQLWRVSLLWQHDNSPWPAQVPLNSFWPSCCRFNTMEIAITWIRMHKTTTFIQKNIIKNYKNEDGKISIEYTCGFSFIYLFLVYGVAFCKKKRKGKEKGGDWRYFLCIEIISTVCSEGESIIQENPIT